MIKLKFILRILFAVPILLFWLTAHSQDETFIINDRVFIENVTNYSDSRFDEPQNDSTPFLTANSTLLEIKDVTPELDPSGRIPLLLIHGWSFAGKPAPPGTGYWTPFKSYFLNNPYLRDNFKMYYVEYWSNAVSVNQLGGLLRDMLELKGLHQQGIAIVAHSMGGLVSRSFMNEHNFTMGKNQGQKCGDNVRLLITLGTPHHGSPMANGEARDENVSFTTLLYMRGIESFVFSQTKYNEVNRSDLRWDNFDQKLNYTKYPNERNDWLTTLNNFTVYDPKLICYAATVTGTQILIPNGVSEQYKMGSFLMKDIFGYDNDGIVPYQSGSFEGHTPKKVRKFEEYNHADIATGKGDRMELYTALQTDLLEIVPPTLIWPNLGTIYVKHSQTYQIRWQSTPQSQKVNLYLSLDNGENYSPIALNVDAQAGMYNWIAPDTNCTQCLIRITDQSDETLFSQTENPFTIYRNQLTVLNIVTKGYFVPNTYNPIEWDYVGLPGRMNIRVLDARSGILTPVSSNILLNPGKSSIEWNPGKAVGPSDSCWLIFELTNMNELYADSESYIFQSEPFIMLGTHSIALLSPINNEPDEFGTEGVKLESGNSVKISWETEGEIKYVRISLCDSLKNELFEIRKRTHKPGLKSYGELDWNIPLMHGNHFFLKLEAGPKQSEIYKTIYSESPIRINYQPVLLTPSKGEIIETLFSCIEFEGAAGATGYQVAILDSFTNGEETRITHVSEYSEFCLAHTMSNELVPGKTYVLNGYLHFGQNQSYPLRTWFSTAATKPTIFTLITPAIGDSLYSDTILFSWNRPVGASRSVFELIHKNETLLQKELEPADTLFSVPINKNSFRDTLFWKVTAENPYGETTINGYFFNKDYSSIKEKVLNGQGLQLACFPNPVAHNSYIQFMLPHNKPFHQVELILFTLTGQKNKVIFTGDLENGLHQFNLNTEKERMLEKGIYILVLRAGENTKTLKIVVKE
jgi:pimeloyl-ACP methyl ester carboxylesterase